MNKLIEAMAKAIVDASDSSILPALYVNSEKTREHFRREAKAAYTAMVEAMGDEDVYEVIRVAYQHQVTTQEKSTYCDEFRAALLKLVEVDHDDED